MNNRNVLVSLRLTVLLLLILSAVLGLLTALEATDRSAGQGGAYHLYGSWWMATLLGLLFANIVGFLFTKRMRRKPAVFLMHVGLSVLLIGAFLSWKLASRGMIYLAEGQNGNELTVSGKLWVEIAKPDGAVERVELTELKKHEKVTSAFLAEGIGEITLSRFYEHSKVTDKARPSSGGPGVPAVTFAIPTPHGEHEFLLAEGLTEHAEISGVRVALEAPSTDRDDQPFLLLKTEEGQDRVGLDLTADVGRVLHILDHKIVILEYDPEFRVGRPADLSRSPTNPALLVELDTESVAPETMRVFSRFPGFLPIKSPGVIELLFVMPLPSQKELRLYPVSDQGWRFTFKSLEEDFKGTVALGDTFFLPTGAGGLAPIVVRSLLDSAEVFPEVIEASDGPAAVRLELHGMSEWIWLVVDGPEVVLPTADQQTQFTLKLTNALPLPFRITLQDAQREDYPNSTTPRIFRSNLRFGEEVGEFGDVQELETNAPISHKGWMIYQAEYGKADGYSWSGLEIARDPGAPVVAVGVGLLFLGFFVHAFSAVRRRGKTAILLLLFFTPQVHAAVTPFHLPMERLMISENGRIKPLVTLAREQELIMGVDFPGNPFDGMLAMALDPDEWKESILVPVQESLAQRLGISATGEANLSELESIVGEIEIITFSSGDADAKAAGELLGIIRRLLALENLFALAPSHSLDKDWISPTMDGCPDWAAEGWQEVRGLYRGEDEVAAHEAAERLVEDQRLRLGNALPSRFRVEAELLWGKLNPPSLLPWIAGAALMLHLLGIWGVLDTGKAGIAGTTLVTAAQASFLGIWIVLAGRLPLLNSWEVYFLVLFLMPFLGLMVELKSKMSFVGAVAVALTLIGAVGHGFLPEYGSIVKPPVAILQSSWRELHILSTMASYAILFLASGMSIALLIRPKDKQIERMSHGSVLWGVALLGLGIATGAAWAYSAWGRYWGWDPKEVWALIAWLIFGASLHARAAGLVRARGWALLNLMGFLALLFTFFGVTYLLPGLHSYG